MRYPIDVADLVARLKKRGDAYTDMLGHLDSVTREDEKLSVFAWELSRGWFPTLPDRTTLHSGMDLGLPHAGGDPYVGAPVYAIADGEVVYADPVIPWSLQEYDFGRVIVRHPVSGGDAYALYMHLGSIKAHNGKLVKEGDLLGAVGWHGSFHHLHFAVASQKPLGGPCPEQMVEAEANALPEGDGLWNTLRLKVNGLDPNEWIGMMMFDGPWYLIHPIEFVRAMNGLEYSHYNGVGSPHTFAAAATTVSGQGTVKVGELLGFKALHDDKKLLDLAHGKGDGLAKGDEKGGKENKDAIRAMQEALILCHYLDLKPALRGIFGPASEKALKAFQKGEINQNPKMLSMLKNLGRPDGDAVTGKLDRFTLIALDSVAKAHQHAGVGSTASAPAATAAEEPKRPTDAPASSPPAAGALALDPWPGFDAVKKTPSIRFGLRMYKALLAWELIDEKGELRVDSEGKPTGCFYSVNGTRKTFPAYGTRVEHFFHKLTKRWKTKKDKDTNVVTETDNAVYAEWPRIDLFMAGDGEVSLGETYTHMGKTYKHLAKYQVYNSGATWIADGFTNCCNSQYAALYVACGGKIQVKTADRGLRTFSLRSDNTGDRIGGQDAALVIQQTIMGVAGYKGDDLKSTLLSGKGFGLSAMTVLNAGAPVHEDGKFTKVQPALKKVLIGDWGNWTAHHFLVADVMYRIKVDSTVDPKKKKTSQFYVTQSRLATKSYKDLKPEEITNYSKAMVVLKREDLDKLERDEAGFKGRVEELIKDCEASGATFQGKPIVEFEVVNICIFTANQKNYTIHGEVYDVNETTRECKLNEAANNDKTNWVKRGITRWWPGYAETSFGRWYGPIE
jgi:hypothetical protein